MKATLSGTNEAASLATRVLCIAVEGRLSKTGVCIRHTNTLFARLTIVSLFVSPAGPAAGWQFRQATTAQPAAQAKPSAPAQPADAYDIGGPRTYTTSSGARLVFYQPQIADWPDQKHMTCYDGVWFRSTSPKGPWEVTDSVPGQIYEIPISSPAHSVTYVTVEDSDDDTVTFVAAAAYAGMMVAWGCAVWGNGWYYPPYYPGYWPVYYPRYPTYGYGAWYNPWTGAYGRGGSIYGPYGGAGYAARYNPTTGRYSRGAVAYGPYGGRGAAEAWNPRTVRTRRRGRVRTCTAAGARPPCSAATSGHPPPASRIEPPAPRPA